jgi:hypothetical protein
MATADKGVVWYLDLKDRKVKWIHSNRNSVAEEAKQGYDVETVLPKDGESIKIILNMTTGISTTEKKVCTRTRQT